MARLFNGTSDQIRSPAAIGFNGLSVFTAGIWAKHSGGTYLLEIPDVVSGSNGFDIRHTGTGFAAGLKTSTQAWAQTAAVATDANWHLWLVTYDGSTLTLFKDGVSSATLGRSGTAAAAADELDIGVFGTFGARWGGNAAEGCVWTAVLSPEERGALARGVSPARIRRPAHLIYYGLWGLGSTEPDLTGKGKNGTIVGTSRSDHAPVGRYAPLVDYFDRFNPDESFFAEIRAGGLAYSPGP